MFSGFHRIAIAKFIFSFVVVFSDVDKLIPYTKKLLSKHYLESRSSRYCPYSHFASQPLLIRWKNIDFCCSVLHSEYDVSSVHDVKHYSVVCCVRNSLSFIAVHYAKLADLSQNLKEVGDTFVISLKQLYASLKPYQVKWEMVLVRSANI